MPSNIQPLYKLYVHIRESGLPNETQTNLIRALLSGEDWNLRVVGVSKAALERIRGNNFRRTKDIHRGHIKPFRDTCQQMLQTVMTEAEWCPLAYENDQCHLVTKEENNTENLSKIIQIDYKLGYFRNRQIGYAYSLKKEGAFLKELALKEL